ncbi:MAG: HNH endonuclease [Nanoarchaeota archaeon]|nr:HNH endonuclease [Nanoarchaeota archaeon]
MGQAGDQSLNFAQNKTLNESGSNGVDVHLFEVFKKNEYVYQGRVELVANPYHEKQLDKDGKLRKVWMFPLKIIDGKVLSIKRDLLIAKQNQAEKRARKLSEKELLKRIKNLSKKAGCRTVSGNQYERNAYVAELARKRSNGVCQLCDSSAPFKNKAGEPFLEVHHIIWLSRNGDDTIDNTVALCPNCHRRMHILDKKADKDKLLIRLEVNKQ